jgi:hypothetical protein
MLFWLTILLGRIGRDPPFSYNWVTIASLYSHMTVCPVLVSLVSHSYKYKHPRHNDVHLGLRLLVYLISSGTVSIVDIHIPTNR